MPHGTAPQTPPQSAFLSSGSGDAESGHRGQGGPALTAGGAARGHARRAGLALAGNGVYAAGLFARNVLLARLLPVEAYGLAATLMILFALAEAAQDAGMNQLIVQSDRGDEPAYQASLQGVQVQFALFAGLLALVMALPFALFLGGGQAPVHDFALIAGLGVLTGFVHLDVWRLQRAGNYRVFALFQSLPTVVSLAAIYPLYLWLGDHRVAIGMIAVQQATRLIVSHGLAKRAYALARAVDMAREARRFALPLLMNGGLLFLAFNGERMIVAGRLGLETVGWFSAAYLLCFAPANIVGNTVRALFLPALSRVKAVRAAFARRAQAALEATIVIALCFSGGLILLGPVLINQLFGPAFAPALAILPLLVIAQALRVCRAGVTVVAVSQAMTRVPLKANLLRCAGLIGAGLAVFAMPVESPVAGLMTVAALALAGEAAALALAVYLVAARGVIDARDVSMAYIFSVGGMMALLSPALVGVPTLSASLFFAGFACAAATQLTALRDLWRTLKRNTHSPQRHGAQDIG